MFKRVQDLASPFVPLCCLTLLVACAGKNTTGSPESARLVVTTTIYPGNNTINYELVKDDQVTTAVVKRAYNAPTNHDCYSGNLVSIYEVLTASLPENPSTYQTVDSLLPALEDHGWNVMEDEGKRVMKTPRTPQNVRTIVLERSPTK